MKNKIAPSLLSANFANLELEIKRCEEAGADLIHFDVMDGHFVPNITIGPLLVEPISRLTKLDIDCHLMITEPDRYIENFARAGAKMLSVHVEAVPHLHRTLAYIKSFNVKAGIALNPITPLCFAFEAAEYCDFILLMSVNPGFAAQSFIDSFHKRARALRKFLDENDFSHVEIEVDGGVKIDNVKEMSDSGANIFVSGSGLFSGDLVQNIRAMREALS